MKFTTSIFERLLFIIWKLQFEFTSTSPGSAILDDMSLLTITSLKGKIVIFNTRLYDIRALHFYQYDKYTTENNAKTSTK